MCVLNVYMQAVLSGSTVAFMGEIGYNSETKDHAGPARSQLQAMLEELVELAKTSGLRNENIEDGIMQL